MKKIILKILLILVVLAIIALGVYGLMKLLGVDSISGLQEVCNKYGKYSYLIIITLQIIQVVFIPISNQIITIPAIAVIGIIPAFICSWIGIEIGTIILYLIGRKGGGKLLEWILSDKEKVEKTTTAMKTRKLFYIVGMLINVIPDDILTCVAGCAKLNFLYVLIVSAITRAICVASTVFGFGLLTQTWWGIIILVVLYIGIIYLGYLFLRYETKIEAWVAKKFRRKKNEEIQMDSSVQ